MLSTAQFYLRRHMTPVSPLFREYARQFSAFSKVEGNSISISSQLPPKLRIPINDNVQYDFTLLAEETVKQFEDKVKASCKGSGMSHFKLVQEGDSKAIPEAKLEDILKKKFQIEVNRSKYDVYPQFETMIEKPKSKDIIDKIFDGRSVPIARRVILYHYLDGLLRTMNLQNTNTLNEAELKKSLDKGIDEYVKDYDIKIYKNPLEQLAKAEAELGELKNKYTMLENVARRYASKLIFGGFMAAAGQLGAMGYLIFIYYSWEVMEPVTYMVSTFYAAVGALFYVRFRRDFEMQSAYDMFTERKMRRLFKKNKFDEKKIQFLEKYISELKDQIGILKNEKQEILQQS